MMKTLILGDIHGRAIWKRILAKEKPYRVIFLGDYVTSTDGIGAHEQLKNLDAILALKDEMGDKCVLLRGNHDIEHLTFPAQDWALTSRYQPDVAIGLEKRSERFLASTQWVYELWEGWKSYLFSHAGISSVWLRDSLGLQTDDVGMFGWIAKINAMKPSPLFGFIPDCYRDHDGSSPSQPLTWIRPLSLMTCMPERYSQVVGHTPVYRRCYNLREALGDAWKGPQFQDLWLADGLEKKAYLVIEDGEFKSKKL